MIKLQFHVEPKQPIRLTRSIAVRDVLLKVKFVEEGQQHPPSFV